MRTTVTIDDALLDQAKRLAMQRRCALGDVIDEALRLLTYRQQAATKPRPRTLLRTFAGKGLLPGVDLDNTAALADLMEGR
jgi:hypothetical protein